MPHDTLERVAARALIRAKHINQIVDALADTPTISEMGEVVDAAINDSPTIIAIAEDAAEAAAPDAVDTYVGTLDVIEGDDPRLPQSVDADEVVYTITDADDRASWVEITTTGRPSINSKRILQADLGTPEMIPDTVDALYVITDDGDRESLAIDTTGQTRIARLTVGGSSVNAHLAAVTDGTSGVWVHHLTTGTSTQVAPAGTTRAPRIAGDAAIWEDGSGATWWAPVDASRDPDLAMPEPGIVGYGDSLTYGNGTGYLARLATLTGQTTYNRGVSSQGPAAIAARQGGEPTLVTVSGGSIPTSGAVTTSLSVNLLLGVGSGTITGTLAGVHGTLTTTSFTRTTGGSAVSVPSPAPFIPDDAVADRGRLQIIWTGRNNPAAAEPLIAPMLDYLAPLAPRYLILSQTNATTEPSGNATYNLINLYNAQMADRYGDRYLDVRSWLVNDAIYDVGLTPTAPDLANMALDAPPPQIMADTIHPIASVYTALGDVIHDRLVEKGWA